jgi:hypothetical protein
METKNKVMITFLTLIAIIAIFYSSTQWVTKTTGYTVGEDERTLLVHCLKEKNSKLYILPDCKSCINQRALFGNAFSQINYIDCSVYNSCPKNIKFPSWEIDGTLFQGNKSLEELKSLSHCN